MQTLFSDAKKRSLLGGGLGMVTGNLRYIFWFWLLNLTLAEFGTAAFRRSAHAILDHSLYSGGLVHGFDAGVLIELLLRPEFGPLAASAAPAAYFAFLFFVATALFLPGVFAGYAAPYRLPRHEFFRAFGQNLWRFVRLMTVAGIVIGIVAALLFTLNGALGKKAGESRYELLPFEVQTAGLVIIFLVMTTLRIWFDLAEADIVLSDQRAVRKSIWAGLQHTLRSLGRLLASYVFASVIAGIILLAGLWIWVRRVASHSVLEAVAVSQVTLFLLLIPRFWQRGIAVSYWQHKMLAPATEPASPPLESAPAGAVPEPAVAPVAPGTPPESGGS
jgi:hypothetical protein